MSIFHLMDMKPSSSLGDFKQTVPDAPSYANTPSGPKGVTPVWDDNTNSLKAIPNDKVKAFVDAGYKVGGDAQTEALKNSPLAKLGAFAGGAANVVGGLDATLAATGRKDLSKNLANITDANPYSSIAGNLAGQVGIGAAGGFAPLFGEGAVGTARAIGDAVAGGKSKLGTAAGWLANAASHATMSLGQDATRGVLDEYTREKMLSEPTSVEKIAASGLQSVGNGMLWGAALGTGLQAVKSVRSATGSALKKLEDISFFRANMVKDAEATIARGPQLSRETFTTDSRDVRSAKIKGAATNSATEETRTATSEDDRIKREVRTLDDDSKEYKTRTQSYGKQAETKTIFGQAKLAHTEQAAEAAGVAPSEIIHPSDTEFHHVYPSDYTVEQKQSAVRKLIKERLSDNQAASELWGEVPMLEAHMTEIAGKSEHAVKWQQLKEKKDLIKQLLTENVPADIGPDGVARDSFENLNREYARVSGNPFVDAKASRAKGPAGAAKPVIPKARTPEPRAVGRVTTTSGDDLDELISSKNRHLTDEKDLRDTRTKSSENTFSQDKTASTVNVEGNATEERRARHSVTYVHPRLAPVMRQVGYEPVFSSQKILNTGLAVGLVSRIAGAKTVAAMYGVNTAVRIAGHHEAIGRAYEKLVVGLAKKGIVGVKELVAEENQRGQKRSTIPEVQLANYNNVANFVNHASTNPEAVQQYLEQTYPNIKRYHPEILAHVTGVTVAAANHLQNDVVKKPFDPSLQPQEFKPPRAQQVRLLRTWDALCHPEEALRSGDPQAIAAVQAVFPNLHKDHTVELTHQISAYKKPIRGMAARNLSRYLGANVRPIDDAAALKRLQETGGMPPSQAGGGQKPSGGSSKVSQQAAQRDLPAGSSASLLG